MYLFNLGYALWKKGDFAGAAERFRAALERDPDDAMATLLLGRCLKKQGFRAGDSADARLQGLERLKTTYQERAYRQLKSLLAVPAVPDPPTHGTRPPRPIGLLPATPIRAYTECEWQEVGKVSPSKRR